MNGLEVLATKTGRRHLCVDLTQVEAGTKIHAYTANRGYTITTGWKGSLIVTIDEKQEDNKEKKFFPAP